MDLSTVRSFWLILAAIVLITNTPITESRVVTHEEIKDALFSLVHMFRAFEDKLERHEYREKALGETFKKNFLSLEKKHRALEPLKGVLSRLDERLSNVETILMQKEEKEREVQEKTNELLVSIQNSVQILALSLPNSSKGQSGNNAIPGGASVASNTENLVVDLGIAKRLESFKDTLNTIKQDVSSVKDTFKKDALPAACLDLALPKHMAETEKLLTKYELKLSEFNSSGSQVQTDFVPLNEVSMSDEAWHSKMTEVMERQEGEIKKIHKVLGDAEGLWKALATRTDMDRVTNSTIEAVFDTQNRLLNMGDTKTGAVLNKLQEMYERSLTTQQDVQKSLTDGNVMTEKMYRDVSTSYEQLKNEVQGLAKVEKVMIQTADNVMDTKKRIEYGVNQILVEVGSLVKQQGQHLNNTIANSFSEIGNSIVANQTGALTNLSSKIEEEMSHVWRQIGTMYRQLTASKQALDRLQEQTEQYVNGSATTMDSMGNKVSLITTRMTEVDENLNYLLGRLSLVTQEFNQIKTGLGDALDKVKASFLSVQEKLKDNGPGPHQIKPEPSNNDAV